MVRLAHSFTHVTKRSLTCARLSSVRWLTYSKEKRWLAYILEIRMADLSFTLKHQLLAQLQLSSLFNLLFYYRFICSVHLSLSTAPMQRVGVTGIAETWKHERSNTRNDKYKIFALLGGFLKDQ